MMPGRRFIHWVWPWTRGRDWPLTIDDLEILDGIPVLITLDEVKAKLKKADWDLVQRLLECEFHLIHPRAVYGASSVTEKQDHSVGVDGVLLSSRVLAYHLRKDMNVFPFVATIGNGLQSRADESEDMLVKYYFDAIGNLALNKTRKYLETHLKERFGFTCLSHLSPGSLSDWPIEEQQPLFSLLNGAEAAIGIRLTPQFLMVPTKSVSGIFFTTETAFESCQLCPRDHCPGRRAEYSQSLLDKYGIRD